MRISKVNVYGNVKPYHTQSSKSQPTLCHNEKQNNVAFHGKLWATFGAVGGAIIGGLLAGPLGAIGGATLFGGAGTVIPDKDNDDSGSTTGYPSDNLRTTNY